MNFVGILMVVKMEAAATEDKHNKILITITLMKKARTMMMWVVRMGVLPSTLLTTC
jgi:hypothetical protein